MQRKSNDIPLSNAFEVLSDRDSTDEDYTTTDVRYTTDNTKKIRAPPPVIIPGKPKDTQALIHTLKQHATKGFHIKYTWNNTNIYLTNHDERKTFLDLLTHNNTEYYTYTDNNEKTHAFVIRGLDSEPDLEEIKSDIERHDIKITKIYRLRTLTRPLYMVTTGTEVKLSALNNKIKYLAHTKVQWERHINKKRIIQCHRCQRWGHATSNCHLSPRCLKCGEPHLTSTCPKPLDTPPKCANCEEAHTANDVSCRVYATRLAERKRQSQRNAPAPVKPSYVPAPPPDRNVWAERAAAASQQTPIPQQTSQQVPPSSAVSTPSAMVFNRAVSRPLPPPQCVNTPNITDTNHSAVQVMELFEEMKRLNSITNVSTLLTALRDLNDLLSKCNNKTEKFTSFLQFTQDLEKYDF